jgi:hypothetical protein
VRTWLLVKKTAMSIVLSSSVAIICSPILDAQIPLPSISLSSDTNPSTIGNSLDVTATLGSPTATGYVTFTEAGKILGIADVVGGIATFPLSSASNKPASLCSGVGCLGPGTIIKYVSQLGCAYQDTDLMYGGGHDDTACINAALALATQASPIIIFQDGRSRISGDGLQGPSSGYWGIVGKGANGMSTHIIGCSISGNVATLTTNSNILVAGQVVNLDNLKVCTMLNGAIIQVQAPGLSSTQFQLAVSPSNDVPPSQEFATLTSVSGTGFYFSAGSGDAISDGVSPVSGNCELPVGPVPPRGANIILQDFVLNGDAHDNRQYCFGIDLKDVNNVRIENVVLYNTGRYAIKAANVGNMEVTGTKVITSFLGNGTNTDGIHIDGPANDLVFNNDFFQTADDTVAINATEGYCGPISRVKWTNSILDDSWNMIRVYNQDLNVCSNGLVPLVDSVNLDNVSGSVYSGNIANFGNSPIESGTLHPAITSFQWNNSTVTNLYPSFSHPILLTDNIGTMSLTNFTFVSPDTDGLFIENIGYLLTETVDSLTVNNLTVDRTPSGNRLDGILGIYSDGGLAFGILNINGFTLEDTGAVYGPMTCLLCSWYPWEFLPAPANINGIDPTQVTNITGPGVGFTVNSPYPFGPPELFNQLPVGQYTIVATYSGDRDYLPAVSVPLVETVLALGTTTTIAVSPNPSVVNSPVTLTGTILGQGSPSGTITFKDGGAVIGIGVLNAGVTTISVSNLAIGPHSIVGYYSGDADNQQSQSSALVENVEQATTVRLTSNYNPALSLSPVTFVAQVSSNNGSSSNGTVIFEDSGQTLGSAALDHSGVAKLTVTSLTTGQHMVIASYSGDLQNLPSDSAVLSETVQLRSTAVNLISAVRGQQIALTSSIQFVGSTVPTGTIEFVVSGQPIGVGTVDGTGSSTITINLPASPETVTAIYSGDTAYASSISQQTIAEGPPSLSAIVAPSTISIVSQQSGAATVTLTSVNGYHDSLSLHCEGLPSSMSCSFSDAEVILGANNSASVQILIATQSKLIAETRSASERPALGDIGVMCFWPGSWLISRLLSRSRKLNGAILMAAVLLPALFVTGGCGGYQVVETLPGTYQIQVAATGATSGIAATGNLTVQVTQ